jgi:hypothetical protein
VKKICKEIEKEKIFELAEEALNDFIEQILI